MRTLLLLLLTFSSVAQSDNLLQALINQSNTGIDTLFAQPEKYQAQVIYTQINRDKDNVPSFKSYTLGVDNNRYYYPASTVKMPTAFMALEKLNQLKIINLNKETPMRNSTGRSPQTEASTDVTAENMLPNIAHYIKKIFVVSDNDAFNRLYEFLGQKDLNEGLRAKGFENTRIIHRLSVSGFDVEGNRYTNPVSFYHNNKLLYHQGQRYSFDAKKWNLSSSIRGVAQMTNDGEIINEPFDFRNKNYVALQDLHDVLKAVMFPMSIEPSARFDLTEEDYKFLYRVMSTKPKESQYPNYSDKPDNYVKFFIYDNEQDSIPDHIRIFNKVGWAYGFLTDVSYIIDLKNNVEFMIAAAIHVNENQTYNDGVYEYEKIGLPYFSKLGKIIYNYELERKREHTPNLNRFKVDSYY